MKLQSAWTVILYLRFRPTAASQIALFSREKRIDTYVGVAVGGDAAGTGATVTPGDDVMGTVAGTAVVACVGACVVNAGAAEGATVRKVGLQPGTHSNVPLRAGPPWQPPPPEGINEPAVW
jgi:hypothetical protein